MFALGIFLVVIVLLWDAYFISILPRIGQSQDVVCFVAVISLVWALAMGIILGKKD